VMFAFPGTWHHTWVARLRATEGTNVMTTALSTRRLAVRLSADVIVALFAKLRTRVLAVQNSTTSMPCMAIPRSRGRRNRLALIASACARLLAARHGLVAGRYTKNFRRILIAGQNHSMLAAWQLFLHWFTTVIAGSIVLKVTD
jgi:hypothetical protein